jgi:hypothetical protein
MSIILATSNEINLTKKESKMKNSTQLLEQLNQALKAINTAIKRGPLANSVSKENMLETKTLIQNSIKLIEAQNDEA